MKFRLFNKTMFSLTSPVEQDDADATDLHLTDGAGTGLGLGHGFGFDSLAGTTPFASLAATPPSTPNLLAASDSGRSSTDNITMVTAPVFSGTATAGDLVNLYDVKGSVSTLVGKAIANSKGTWSITSSTLQDGVHNLSATATDKLNNVSVASAALAVTIDTKAPVAPAAPDLIDASDSGIANNDNITNLNMPTVSGITEAKAHIDLFDANTNSLLGSVNASSKGVWSIASTKVLADGQHKLYVVATDVAGNISSSSNPLLVNIDTTAPAAPILDMAASSDSGRSNTDNMTNVATPTFSGISEAGASIALYDGTTALASATANSKGEWSMTTKLAEGVHNLSAKAVDVAGNGSVLSATLAVTIDSTAPTAPGAPDLLASSDTGSSDSDNVTEVTSPVFSGTAEANAVVSLFDGNTNLVVGSTTADSKGGWTITSNPLAQGKHSMSVTATDVAGNVSAQSAALVVTIETAAPTAPSTPDLLATSDSGMSNADNITNANAPLFSGIAQAGVTINLFDAASSVALGSSVANSKGEWSIAGKLAEGAHALYATATDKLGNVSARSGSLAVTIDTTAPAAVAAPDLQAGSDSGRSNTDNITNAPTPAFSGVAEAGAFVTLLDGSANLKIGSATANSLGAWSITSSALLDGAHSVHASVTDVAGNTTISPAALALTVDTKAPGVTINVPFVTNDNTPTLSGTGEYGGEAIQVYFYKDGTPQLLGNTTVDSLGNWNYTVPQAADGTYTVFATQRDVAGNDGTSGKNTGTIDTVAPTITLDIPVLTNNNAPTINGTGEYGSGAIKIWNAQNNTVFATTTVDASGHWRYTMPITADGTYTVYASQDDAAGNHGVSASKTGTIDTHAPTVTLSIPALTNNNAPTISGTGEYGSGAIKIWNAQNSTVFATATVDTSGHWSYTMPATPDGTYTVYATQDDAAGNHGKSSSQTGTIDTTAPIVTLNSFSTHGGIGTLSGRGEVGASQVDIYFNGSVFGSAVVSSNGTWQYPVTTPVPASTYQLTAAQHDAAGNTGYGSGTVVVLDLRGAEPLPDAFATDVAHHSAMDVVLQLAGSSDLPMQLFV